MDFILKTEANGACLIVVSGSINEYSQPGFRRIATLVRDYPALTVDLRAVDIINSIGTIYWVEFLRALLRIAPVTLSQCSLAMVEYMNRVPAMCAGAAFSSFLVPYRCPECLRLFVSPMNQSAVADGHYPETCCGRCGSPADGAIPFAEYTRFSAACR